MKVLKILLMVVTMSFLGCSYKEPNLHEKVAELRQLLNSSDNVNIGNGISVNLEDDNETINISFENNILFDFNKYNVKKEFKGILKDISNFLVQNPKFGVSVEGHTDSIGSIEKNQELSEKRALAVSSVLIKYNVPSERIITIGYGESSPNYDNSTKEGREGNRRAEIRLKEHIQDFIEQSVSSQKSIVSTSSLPSSSKTPITDKNEEEKLRKQEILQAKIEEQCKYAKPVATGTKFLSGLFGFLQGINDGDIVGHIDANLKVADNTTWIKGVEYACP